MITVTTPIGEGTLVGQLRMANRPVKYLVQYNARATDKDKRRVMERAAEMGIESYMPYLGGPTMLVAWDREDLRKE
jgi:hypothetical protein